MWHTFEYFVPETPFSAGTTLDSSNAYQVKAASVLDYEYQVSSISELSSLLITATASQRYSEKLVPKELAAGKAEEGRGFHIHCILCSQDFVGLPCVQQH